MAKQSAIKTTLDMGDDPSIRLEFEDGRKLLLRASRLTPSMQARAMLHGLSAKLVDAAAIPRDTVTGRSATVMEKFEAVEAVYGRLLAGQWNAVRTGESANKGGLLYRALCEFYQGKRTPEGVREWLNARTPEEKRNLEINPRIKTIIDRLEAERIDPNIDTDAMLDEMGSDD